VPAGKLDPDGVFFLRPSVVLRQLSAHFAGFDADHGVVSRVVVDRAAEHLGPNHALAQGIDLAFQGMSNDELKEILGAFAPRERLAGEDFFEVTAHQNDSLWTEFIPFASWPDGRHAAARDLQC
jgi:hypothetical protein